MNNLENVSTRDLAFRINELEKIISDCQLEQIKIAEEIQRRYPNSKIEEHIQCKKLERKKEKDVKRN